MLNEQLLNSFQDAAGFKLHHTSSLVTRLCLHLAKQCIWLRGVHVLSKCPTPLAFAVAGDVLYACRAPRNVGKTKH